MLRKSADDLGVAPLDGEMQRCLLADDVSLAEQRHLADELLAQELGVAVVHRAPRLSLCGSRTCRLQEGRRGIAEEGVSSQFLDGRALRLILLGFLLGGRQRPLSASFCLGRGNNFGFLLISLRGCLQGLDLLLEPKGLSVVLCLRRSLLLLLELSQHLLRAAAPCRSAPSFLRLLCRRLALLDSGQGRQGLSLALRHLLVLGHD
mmetsp:Transcript_39796/g.99996  ORF Transcript_39796/g.99996 Transcript_39796/m.99996 type:complete len:205 (-) Transcript_39796:52-666(-)